MQMLSGELVGIQIFLLFKNRGATFKKVQDLEGWKCSSFQWDVPHRPEVQIDFHL